MAPGSDARVAAAPFLSASTVSIPLAMHGPRRSVAARRSAPSPVAVTVASRVRKADGTRVPVGFFYTKDGVATPSSIIASRARPLNPNCEKLRCWISMLPSAPLGRRKICFS